MVKGILGIFLALVSLWGGAYALNYFPISHWASFPTALTATFSFISGMALALIGFVK